MFRQEVLFQTNCGFLLVVAKDKAGALRLPRCFEQSDCRARAGAKACLGRLSRGARRSNDGVITVEHGCAGGRQAGDDLGFLFCNFSHQCHGSFLDVPLGHEPIECLRMHQCHTGKHPDLGLDDLEQILHVAGFIRGVDAHLGDVELVFFPIGQQLDRCQDRQAQPIHEREGVRAQTENIERKPRLRVGFFADLDHEFFLQDGVDGMHHRRFAGTSGDSHDDGIIFSQL